MAPYTTTYASATTGSTAYTINNWAEYTPVWLEEDKWEYEPQTDSYINKATGTRIAHEEVERFGGIIKAITKLQIANNKQLLDRVQELLNFDPKFRQIREDNSIDYKDVIK